MMKLIGLRLWISGRALVRADRAIAAMGDTTREMAVEPRVTLRYEILNLRFALQNFRAEFWLAVSRDVRRAGTNPAAD